MTLAPIVALAPTSSISWTATKITCFSWFGRRGDIFLFRFLLKRDFLRRLCATGFRLFLPTKLAFRCRAAGLNPCLFSCFLILSNSLIPPWMKFLLYAPSISAMSTL